MNILVVSPLFPTPTSGQNTRNFHLLQTLARYHRVSLLALERDPQKIPQEHLALLSTCTDTLQVISPPASAPKRWQQMAGLVRGVPYVLREYILPEVQEALDTLFS